MARIPGAAVSRVVLAVAALAGEPVRAFDLGAATVADPAPVFRPGRFGEAIASDGTGFLTVWIDSRTATVPGVLGARVTSNGVVLDEPALEIGFPRFGRCAERPVVAWDGAAYVVAWSDTAQCAFAPALGSVRVARVAPDGTVLDLEPATLGTTRDGRVSVAALGPGALVAWVAPDLQVHGAIVVAGVAGPAFAVTRSPAEPDRPAVGRNGTKYLVAWSDGRGPEADLWAARVASDGTVLDPDGFAVDDGPGPQVDARVASDGAGFAVLASMGASGYAYTLGAVRVGDGGAVLDADPAVLSSTSVVLGAPAASCWDGTRYVIGWRDGAGTLRAARLGADGAVLDPGGFVVTTTRPASSLFTQGCACAGATCLLAAQETGQLLQDGLPAATPAVRVTEANAQVNPAVAWNGQGYLVAWSDARSALGDEIFARRVSAAGLPVGLPFAVGSTPFAMYGLSQELAVAASGGEFLVSWHDASDGRPRATRVSAAGAVVGDPAFAVSAVPVAGGPAGYLALLPDMPSSSKVRVRAVRLAPDGTPIDAMPIVLQPETDGVTVNVAAARDSSGWVVAWSIADPWGGRPGVAFARIGDDGVAQPAGGVALGTMPRDAQSGLGIGAAGGTALVAWAAKTHVEAVRVAAAPLDATPLVLGGGSATVRRPGVLWTGTRFLVTWSDERTCCAPGVYAASVGLDGAVDAATVPVAAGPLAARNAAAAATGDGGALFAWQQYQPAAGAVRVTLRAASRPGPPAPDGGGGGGGGGGGCAQTGDAGFLALVAALVGLGPALLRRRRRLDGPRRDRA